MLTRQALNPVPVWSFILEISPWLFSLFMHTWCHIFNPQNHAGETDELGDASERQDDLMTNGKQSFADNTVRALVGSLNRRLWSFKLDFIFYTGKIQWEWSNSWRWSIYLGQLCYLNEAQLDLFRRYVNRCPFSHQTQVFPRRRAMGTRWLIDCQY